MYLCQSKRLTKSESVLVNKVKTYCDLPNVFWERKKHIVSLLYEQNFDERQIPIKARPSQIKFDYIELCKKEIQTLLEKNLIRKSYAP